MNKFSTEKKAFDETEDEINLRELVFKYFHYWRWFVISVIVFLVLGVFAYLRMDREYDIAFSILLKEDKGTGGAQKGALGSLADLGLLSTTNNIDNEVAVFSSPNLMKQTILALELQTSYYENGIFRNTEVYNECPYYVRLEDVKPEELKGEVSFTINRVNDNGVDIDGEYIVKKEKYNIKGSLDQLPGFIELPEGMGRLYVAYRPNIDVLKREEGYNITIQNAQSKAYQLVKDLNVSPTSKSSSVLNINMNVMNIQKGIDILNEMVKLYNLNNVNDNNEIAINTSIFVDGRLKDIQGELKGIEDEVVDYKKSQSITDLGEEAKIYVEQTSSVEQKRIDIATQLQTIELVDNFVNKSDNSYKLIPNLGITDTGLAAIIANYNAALLAYERLESSASENNPARARALSDLTNTRESIQAAIINVKRALNISKQEIDKQALRLSSRISSVPMQERGLLEIMRQQQIKQSLYLYLMQVKEETNITMASTSDKAKVITDPIIPEGPKSPKRNIILLVCLLIGLAVPIAIIYIKDLLQINIGDRQELEKLSKVPVIGEIMKKDANDDTLVVKSNRTTPIVELFRSLRNNIQFVLNSSENKNTILVTSTVPGEGKTFVSINLAASFTLSDKKVLLIGMDIRNPKLASDMGFRKGAGLTSYLSGSEPDWKPLLIKMKDYPSLDILQAGVIPPNPNELLMKPAMKELLIQARNDYDIVIIDSAPIGVVSDTFLLSSLADVTVYVTRENVTPKQAINFVNEVYQDHKLPNMYMVLNGAELSKNKGRYGYGYTYGYGDRK